MSILQSISISDLQQANWFLYKYNPTGLTDKISIAVKIESAIDIKAIKSALKILTERHSILRSIYYEENGYIKQKNLKNIPINLKKIEVKSSNNEELNLQLLQQAKHPFNLEKGSVLRACLFNLGVTENILLLTVNQIAADRESLLILLSEFVDVYDSIINGDIPKLMPLNTSYTDYLKKELDWLDSSACTQIARYWQHKLADELPVLELPTSSPRPTIRTYNGAAIKFTINPQLTQQLKQLGKAQEITIVEILLSVFKVILYRYTGEEDILVGFLQNRENNPLFKGVVGNFANVTVTRTSISGEIKFTELLNKVSQEILEIEKYKNYPFARLVKQLKPSDLSHPPICQAAFGYSKFENLFKEKELKLEFYELPQQKVDFELSLEAIELPESVLAYFKYNSDVLEAETVAQIAEHFQNLLTSIVENPQTPVGKLVILSEREKQKILVEWNDTKTDDDLSECVHQLFEAQVEKIPEATAVVFEDQKLTYSSLNSKANQLAHYLQKLGVQPETKVGICVERSLEMVVGLLGILKAGGAYIPLDPGYPPQRINYMLADSQLSVLLTQE